MAIPLLEGCDIAGKDVTGDALLTQRARARYIVKRHAHYHFTVKGNQPTLERDIALLFETRRIQCSTALNATLTGTRGQSGALEHRKRPLPHRLALR